MVKVDILGIGGIVIGVILSVYFYLKSLKIKQPNWTIKSNNLIRGWSGQIENLEIKYENGAVENLTISRIIFWNNGKETIDGDDLQTINPLRIEAKENVKILSVSVIENNKISSEFKVTNDKQNNYAIIDFNYLDFQQGAVIQVIHTGKSSGDIFIIGDIKGVKELSKQTPTFDYLLIVKQIISSRIWKLFYVAISILGILAVIVGISISFVSFFGNNLGLGSDMPPVGVGMVLFFVGFFIFIPAFSYSRKFNPIPKGLELYYSEIDIE
jgi:hypothetical protein